jgi:hypothetical protein
MQEMIYTQGAWWVWQLLPAAQQARGSRQLCFQFGLTSWLAMGWGA